MINSKNNFAKALIFGCAIFSSITILKAQTGACFTSLNDYSYAYPSDSQCFSAMGDVNMDGKPDIVNTTVTNKITTLLGTGNGTFINGPTTTYGYIPLVHRLKDINGDGKLDMVTMNVFSNNVGILLGTGTGSFVPTATLSAGWPGASSQFSDLILADVNNDTKADIVTCIGNINPSIITVMLGSGTGTFAPAVTYTTSGGPVRMAADDMNNDGNIDLVLSCGSSLAVIHPGNGTGSFAICNTIPSSTFGKGVVINDFNADGKKDFAFANWMNNTITIFMGNGAGSYTMSVMPNIADTPCFLECADFNNDGKKDLAVQTDGSVVLYNGNGNGTFTFNKNLNIDMNSNLQGCLEASDFNADGKMDLMCASTAFDRRVYTFINKGAGNLFAMTDIKFPSASCGGGGLVDDLNGDGKQDIIISSLTYVEVAMGTSGGNYATPIQYTIGAGGQNNTILEADFNNDGKQDIVAVNIYPHSLNFLAGNGAGSFSATTTMSLSIPAYDAEFGDFNNDGKKDVAFTSNTANAIYIYSGNGSGGFTFAGSFATAPSPAQLTVGDFNNDGNADIAYGHFNINGAYVVFGNGANVFSAPVIYSTAGNAPLSIGNKDVNADGKTDLIVANYGGASSIAVLLGTTSGTFQPAAFFSNGGSTKDIVVDDMNGDGFQDIITGNYGNSGFSVLLGNGAGSFASSLDYPIGRVYSGFGWLAVKDMNNDGTKDVIVRANINANFSLGRNNVIISYNNSAVINSVGSNTICLGNTLTLHATSGAFSYLWNPGGSTADSLVVGAAGVYSVTVVNPSGTCSSTASKTITVVVCTGIENISKENLSLNIYPNPNNGDFTIQTTEDEIIVIANELGQVVQSLNLNSGNNFRASVNNLASGVYFVKGKTENRKVVVVK